MIRFAFWRREHEPIEPAWETAITDPAERKAIAGHWRIIQEDLRRSGNLGPCRDHAMFRLALAYLAFDRACPALVRDGAADFHGDVGWQWQVAQQASAMATAIERELGLTPR
jgi:hypothetical protein